MIILDGTVLDNDLMSNAGLFYGESPFTSILRVAGNYQFLDDHLHRLSQSITFLYGRTEQTELLLRELGITLAQLSIEFTTEYVRVTLFKGEDQKYHYMIKQNAYSKSSKNSLASTASMVRAESILPNYLKIGNYVATLYELKQAQLKGFDDILYLDKDGNLSEFSFANLFFIQDDQIFTPKLSSKILAGITRSHLIKSLKQVGLKVSEGDYHISSLSQATCLFKTNCLIGITKVDQLDDQSFAADKTFETVKNIYNDYLRERYEK